MSFIRNALTTLVAFAALALLTVAQLHACAAYAQTGDCKPGANCQVNTLRTTQRLPDGGYDLKAGYGYFDRLTVGGFSVCTKDGGACGSAGVTALYPLYSSAGNIGCQSVALGDGGCLSADALKQYTIMGAKLADNANDVLIVDTQTTFTNGNILHLKNNGVLLCRFNFDGVLLCTAAVAAPLSQFNEIRPYSAAAGIAFKSFRSSSQADPDFTFGPFSGTRDSFLPLVNFSNGAVVVAQIDTGGVFRGGSQNSAGSFIAGNPEGSALTCGWGGATGCYTPVTGGLVNDGEHGDLIVSNCGPLHEDGGCSTNVMRDGGLLVEVQALGRTSSAARANRIYELDTRGSQAIWDGWYVSTARAADLPVCTTAQATFVNGHITPGNGSLLYNVDSEHWETCAGTTADAGREAVCTNGNGLCSYAVRSYAGVPTATDCDQAGEFGRQAIDTTNHKFYWCEGAAGWFGTP